MKLIELKWVKLLFGILLFILFATFLLNCKNDDDDPIVEDRITSIQDFLTIVCENASVCPGLNTTQNEIDMCPIELLNELKASDITTLDNFLELDKTEQDCIIDCLKDNICGRFSLSILNMSDSDLMEPYEDCNIQC